MQEDAKGRPLSETHPHLAEFDKYLKMLEKESDRGAVLISCSMIDELLRRTIHAYLTTDDYADDLLKGPNAPIGSFFARTRLAAALGLIDEVMAAECDLLRRIRNEFAHAVDCSFENPKVISLCDKLKFCIAEAPARGKFDTAAVPVILNLTNRPHYAGQRRLKVQTFPY